MLKCPSCARAYPQVMGAQEQRCPFCGFETRSPEEGAGGAARPSSPVDPVAALAHASRFAARHYPRLLLLWLPVVVLDVLVAAGVTAYQRRLGLEDLASLASEDALALLGVALPLYFVDFAVTFAAWGLLAAYVLDASGPGADRATMRRRFRSRLPAALGMGALLTFALLAGFVLAFVPFLVFLHMFVFAPAAFASGARVGESFDASRRFARERGTYGFTALLVLMMAGLVAVEYWWASLTPGLLAGLGVGSPYAQAAADVLPSWLLAPLLALPPASFWWLAERAGRAEAETGVEKAKGPAGERSRTTKCPRCGTLIPYEPRGDAPVTVKCPSCGTSGRVL